jgi:hypothetical protein
MTDHDTKGAGVTEIGTMPLDDFQQIVWNYYSTKG